MRAGASASFALVKRSFHAPLRGALEGITLLYPIKPLVGIAVGFNCESSFTIERTDASSFLSAALMSLFLSSGRLNCGRGAAKIGGRFLLLRVLVVVVVVLLELNGAEKAL